MKHRRIRNILTALAVLGIVAATTTSAYAIVCRDGTCPWW